MEPFKYSGRTQNIYASLIHNAELLGKMLPFGVADPVLWTLTNPSASQSVVLEHLLGHTNPHPERHSEPGYFLRAARPSCDWLWSPWGCPGLALPPLGLHQEAEKRRADFKHALSAYLNPVGVNVAAGRGVEAALEKAAATGKGPAFTASTTLSKDCGSYVLAEYLSSI